MTHESWKSFVLWGVLLATGTWAQTEAPTAATTSNLTDFNSTGSPAPTGAPTGSPTIPPANSTGAPSPSPTELLNATESPTFDPTANQTTSPTPQPSEDSTTMPTRAPSKPPTKAPTLSPSAVPTVKPSSGLQVETMTGLSMNFFGITEFPEDIFTTWETTTAEYQKQYYASVQNPPITDFDATVTIQSLTLPSRYRHLRGLQEEYVSVLYSQSMQYRVISDDDVDAARVAAFPFAQDAGRNAYVDLLKETGEGVLADITSSSEVATDSTPRPTSAPATAPSPAPAPIEDDGGIQDLTTGAIIGIAVGGGVCLIGILLFCFFSSGDEEYEGDNEPPPSVSVKRGADEVSTLAPPQFGGPPASHESLAGYGDQSVATVDYDYSKAYGGGGDTSVSSAGGTFGSQTHLQSFLDPRTAGATGATLGGFSDADSFEEAYRDPNANVKEELLNVFAPPGKLGVVIDTPNDGAPVVHAVKDSSVIADKIQVGDKLVAVDDEDVRSMTAIKVSKLISRKSANPSRKLTIIRSTVIE